MFKKFLAGTTAILMLASVSPLMTVANTIGIGSNVSTTVPSEFRSNISVDLNGKVTLSSRGAADVNIATLMLIFTSSKEFSFNLSEKFTTTDSKKTSLNKVNSTKNATDKKTVVTIIISNSDSAPIFEENGSVVLGKFDLSNGTLTTDIALDSLTYVLGNEEIVLNTTKMIYSPDIKGETTEPTGQTPVQTTVANSTLTPIQTTTDKSGLRAGDLFTGKSKPPKGIFSPPGFFA